MSAPAAIRSIWGAIASRGAGYESQPIGDRSEPAGVAGYFVDLRAKTLVPSAAEPDHLRPAALAQLALGHWERSLAGEAGSDEAFQRICGLLAARGEPATDGRRWPYALAVRKYGLAPPWCSAMAQGQIASAFVRAHLHTGDERWRGLALEAVGPLLATQETDLVTFAAAGPILEEYPSEPRSHVLNGWIYALWGLRDVHVGLGDEAAGERFAESARCLAARIADFDTGWWALYSLYPHPVRDLAKPFYHRLHASQAEVMQDLTGLPEFELAASRWHRFDEPARRTLAVAQKAIFVARVKR